MRARSTALKTLAATLIVALAAGAWLTLGPTQLGGPATYAVIEGNSMEPMLHANDLAVVRSKSAYDVGDVVAYRSAELDRLVLHRIIEREDERFVLQGDNNDFVDSAQPTQEQIAGELAFSVPRAGALVERLRSTTGFVLLLALAGVVVVGGRRGRRASAASTGVSRTRARSRTGGRVIRADHMQTAMGIAGGTAAVLVLVTLLAFSRSTTETVAAPNLYEQTGTFSYSAVVGDTPAYDTTVAADGQAIFTALADQVDVAFEYELTSNEAHSAAGTASMLAIVTDGEGLERSLTVVAPHEFSGNTVTLAGTLTLRKLQRLIRRIENATGAPSNNYFITLAPLVELAGRVGETTIEESFAPELVFRLDPVRLALAQTSALDASANALVRTQIGSGSRTVPATFDVLGLAPSVETARRIGIIGTIVSVVALIVAFGLSRRQRHGGLATIAARHGQWLALDTNEGGSDRRRVELAEMDDLLHVAELRDQLVLQVDEADRTTYVVDDGSIQYQYTAHGSGSPSARSPADEQRSFAEEQLGEWVPLAEKLADTDSVEPMAEAQQPSATASDSEAST